MPPVEAVDLIVAYIECQIFRRPLTMGQFGQNSKRAYGVSTTAGYMSNGRYLSAVSATG